MARIRSVRPELFQDDLFADVPMAGRYLYIGMACYADKEGRLEDRPRRLQKQVLGYDGDADVDQLLNMLALKGFIVRYEAGGTCYIQMLRWDDEQKPHHKEAESTIPPPEGWAKQPEQAPEGSGSFEANTVRARAEHGADTEPAARLIDPVMDQGIDPVVDRGAGETRPPARPRVLSLPVPLPSLDALCACQVVAEWATINGVAPEAVRADLGRYRDGIVSRHDGEPPPRPLVAWESDARKWLNNVDYGPVARRGGGGGRGRKGGERHAERGGDPGRTAGPATVAERINAGDVHDPEWGEYEGLLNQPRRRSGA